MPPKAETPLSDTEKCLVAVLSQILSEENKVPKLNNVKLAEDLGLPTPDAARVRVSSLLFNFKFVVYSTADVWFTSGLALLRRLRMESSKI